MKGRLWRAGLASVSLAAAVLAPGTLRADEDIQIGAKAPVFFLSTYNPERCGEQRVFLDRLVGEGVAAPRKVLLINFFSIDCKPCRKELPYLQKVFERYRDKGLGVLVVNCDGQDDKVAETLKYVQEAGFTFPVLKDRFQALQRRYGVNTFPATFLVDGAGRIRDIKVGYDPDHPVPLAEIQRRLGVPEEKIEAEAKPPENKPLPGTMSKTGT